MLYNLPLIHIAPIHQGIIPSLFTGRSEVRDLYRKHLLFKAQFRKVDVCYPQVLLLGCLFDRWFIFTIKCKPHDVSQADSSSGLHECVYKMSSQSVQSLLICISLDQSDGLTYGQTSSATMVLKCITTKFLLTKLLLLLEWTWHCCFIGGPDIVFDCILHGDNSDLLPEHSYSIFILHIIGLIWSKSHFKKMKTFVHWLGTPRNPSRTPLAPQGLFGILVPHIFEPLLQIST